MLPKKQPSTPLTLAREKPVTELDKLSRRAVRGLGKRSAGYTSREVKTTYELDATGQRTVKNQVVTSKQNPPDLEAIIFTLTNLEAGRWSVKPEAPPVAAAENAGAGALATIPDDLLRGILRYFPEHSPESNETPAQ